MYEQLGGPASVGLPQVDRTEAGELNVVVTLVEQLGHAVPISEDDESIVRHDLIAAGFRSDNAVWIYFGLRALSVVALLGLALIVPHQHHIQSDTEHRVPDRRRVRRVVWSELLLDYLVSARQQRIREGLPDTLDLIVVCVEAGLALDQAMQHVSSELMDVHPDISKEVELVNLEIRGGKRRAEALRGLADRTGEPELSKLVAVMIQTDRFGTSIADSLRTHSDFMRVRRRQEAEERAAKVGVKLVFPIFFLILPAMLIVVAGPGLLQVFKYLFPLMQEFQTGVNEALIDKLRSDAHK